MIFDIFIPQSAFPIPHLERSRKIEKSGWMRFLKGEISEKIQLCPLVAGSHQIQN
jgi:hypothetical protein